MPWNYNLIMSSNTINNNCNNDSRNNFYYYFKKTILYVIILSICLCLTLITIWIKIIVFPPPGPHLSYIFYENEIMISTLFLGEYYLDVDKINIIEYESNIVILESTLSDNPGFFSLLNGSNPTNLNTSFIDKIKTPQTTDTFILKPGVPTYFHSGVTMQELNMADPILNSVFKFIWFF